jgi:hypothetical protein
MCKNKRRGMMYSDLEKQEERDDVFRSGKTRREG